jgi:SAM-dependent methyltransferase
MGGVAERQGTDPDSPWWTVHVARYRFARPHVEGKRVLDVACGTGYALDLLAESARRVVAVDIDAGAVASARREAHGRVVVAVADACRLPFAAGAFDVVTSFETLEHLDRRAEFLTEVRRVLRPDGLLVLSTPNASYTRPVDGRPRNPFHVHEYTPGELRGQIAPLFASVELLGQALHARFRISPFRDDQLRLPRRPGAQGRRLAWRILHRLPRRVGRPLSALVLRQPLLPTETDYVFSPSLVDRAPTVIAICRPRARG